MKNLIFAVIAAIGLSGCYDESDYKQAAVNTADSFSKPQQVGTLPDGRPVSVVYHYVPGERAKYVYFVPEGGVTANRVEQQGKVAVSQTEYTAPSKPLTAEEKIALAEEKLNQAQQLVTESKALTDSLK